MWKFLKMVVAIGCGIFLIPALFLFAIGVTGTIFGFLAEPRIMMIMIIILAGISIPGMILMFFIKK